MVVIAQQLRPPGMAAGTNLDFRIARTWGSGLGVTGLRVDVPGDTLPLIQLNNQAFGLFSRRCHT
jgi:glycerol-3-phosphate O-acyltransferase